MAKIKSTAARHRESRGDEKPTPAQQRQAIRVLRKYKGAHVPRPINVLIQDQPAATLERCKCIVNWLAYIKQPFSVGDLAAAEADVLHMVADALGHAERVIRSIGSKADAEVTHG